MTNMKSTDDCNNNNLISNQDTSATNDEVDMQRIPSLRRGLLFIGMGVSLPLGWYAYELMGLDVVSFALPLLCLLAAILLLKPSTTTPTTTTKTQKKSFGQQLVFCSNLVYELVLLMTLTQNVDAVRAWLSKVDPSLGGALPEKAYGGNCLVYDWTHEQDPWHNIKDKLDCFVAVHFMGFWLKTLLIRDVRILLITSVGFELIEYSLEHQLHNFNECWWDHWILDVLLCNTCGMLFGLKTLQWCGIKQLNWTKNSESSSDMDRLWQTVALLTLIVVILLVELNSFYLKFVFWIPADHFLNLARILILILAGAASADESYRYFHENSDHQLRFGLQTRVWLFTIFTELLVICKFAWSTIQQPPSENIAFLWACILIATVTFVMVRNWHAVYSLLPDINVILKITSDPKQPTANDVLANGQAAVVLQNNNENR